MIMWLGKKYINHIFITMWNLAYFSDSVEILANIFLTNWLHLHEKVMEMWRKCDELTLVLIFWLLSFENSRHGKKVDDHQRWRKEMTVCPGLLGDKSTRGHIFCWLQDEICTAGPDRWRLYILDATLILMSTCLYWNIILN